MFGELKARGLIKQTTNETKLGQLLDKSELTFYIGFDPTADSLHIGHLLQLVFAKRLMAMGHKPILLIGGATASIGDPTGKTDMRKMLSADEIAKNSMKFTKQFNRIIDGDFHLFNNLGFFSDLQFLTFIREVGPHFSVNNMLRAECFKSRMEQGLSFLEFNYMIMQSWDFFKLHEMFDCTLQVGGDDQWSNMLGGIDLVRRKKNKEVFALTLPLLTTSDGKKMGKTEKGAVWLDAEKTSVFDFFQFWRNIDDAEVKRIFKLLTFVSLDEIERLAFDSAADKNAAKERLAFEVTQIVHGKDAALAAKWKAIALFKDRSFTGMTGVAVKNNVSIIEVIIQAGFAVSKSEARRLIESKGIAINEDVVNDVNLSLNKEKFGDQFILRRGKKNFCKFLLE